MASRTKTSALTVLCLLTLIQVSSAKAQNRKPHQALKQARFWREITQGRQYTNQKRINAAINCYHNAASVAKAGVHYIYLIWGWEDILEQRPFNPVVHTSLAKAFLKANTPRFWDAEVHCKRAIHLSPHHRNVEAENLLIQIDKRRLAATTLSNSSTTAKLVSKNFKELLVRNWNPPVISGFILARYRVVLDEQACIKELRCQCSSGDKNFDDSVSKLLREASYSNLRGLQAPGLLDFAFVTNENRKEIDYSSYGSVVVLGGN